MTEQEELAVLEEEYYRPYPPATTKITRRAFRRKEIVRNRINELRKKLNMLSSSTG